jgi:hypothetical protein
MAMATNITVMATTNTTTKTTSWRIGFDLSKFRIKRLTGATWWDEAVVDMDTAEKPGNVK